MKAIQTNRLVLRQWKDSDRSEFAALNADSEVMEYFASTYDRRQSDAAIDRFSDSIARKQFGFFAAELKETSECIGFIGLNQVPANLPFAPAVEIGWRLAQKFWGKGLANEGAIACLEYGFEILGLNEIVSMTPCVNLKSKKLMQRIGMLNSEKNFIHPAVAQDQRLAKHVLYISSKQSWLSNHSLRSSNQN